MIESHLVEGRQDLCDDNSKLNYGQSITDACVGWEDTEIMLKAALMTLQFARCNNKA